MRDSLGMEKQTHIKLQSSDRERLERMIANRNTPQKHVWRARIVLLAGDGCGTFEIMRRTAKSKPTVWRWQKRFAKEGVEGLTHDKTRPPGKAPLAAALVKRVVELTQQQPPFEETHWTGRTMADAAGISVSSVQRIWRAYGLRPHLVKTFKLSNDPAFTEKLHDIVGLYMNPPEHALVLSVDEKSQIQALDRTQPGLPMKKGRAGTMTHDYKRNGTTTLFAALNVLDGKVIGQCMNRHRHQEFLRFLRKIDRETPKDLALHIIIDNYATHKHPAVKAWLARHPRFHLHFTPTSSSWLNAVEGFFSKLTKKRLKRGVFKSVTELESAILRFIEEKNENAKPFIWTADPDKIIEKINRGKQMLESIH
jgi:transposase